MIAATHVAFLSPLRAFFLAAVMVGLAMQAHARVPEDLTDDERAYHELSVFADALQLLRTQHIQPASVHVLIEGAIRGMTEQLDPYTTYLTAEQFRILKEDTEGQYQGIGVLLQVDKDGTWIQEVKPGSPADKQGLRAGDQLIKINGEELDKPSLQELFDSMRTSAEKSMTLQVQRGEHTFDVEVARKRIQSEPVSAVVRDDGTLYLQVNMFAYNVHKDIAQAIKKYLKKRTQMPTSIILDLRDNPGGLFDEAIATAQLFLNDGNIVHVSDGQEGDHRTWTASPKSTLYEGPLVLWINAHSASSSEIVSAALQDNHRATIVGQKSYGKGTVQQLIPLANHGALKITVTEYLSPMGHPIHERGVTPDIIVEGQARIHDDEPWFNISQTVFKARRSHSP